MKEAIIIDTDALVFFKKRGLLDLLLESFDIYVTYGLLEEYRRTFGQKFMNRYESKFEIIELTEEERKYKSKVIRFHFHNKEIMISFEKGRPIRHEGEIDGITISKTRKIRFIIREKKVKTTAKNFEVVIWDILEFLESLATELREKFLKKIETSFYSRESY